MPEQRSSAADGHYTRTCCEASMSSQRILRTTEFKIYPTPRQVATLTEWLRTCCWVYNQSLEHRIKAYRRRGESISLYTQQAMLTRWRSRIERLRLVPAWFERDAMRRVDRGFKDFFRRCKTGEKPGFPRFRSQNRYNSLECVAPGRYAFLGRIRIPILGTVLARGRIGEVVGNQKLLRIIRRASGWYAQVVADQGEVPMKIETTSSVGIDMGLTSFATLSTGEKIDNPRWTRRSDRKLRHAQRRVSRRDKGSRNRCKAVNRLARIYERIAEQRKDFAHQESRKLVNRFDLIGFEKLNIKGLARTRMAKSIMDAAWGMFLIFLAIKAANAGKSAIAVDPRGTSQECPQCDAIKKKSLSERVHHCPCGCVLDRDHAAAKVILARAARSTGLVLPVEGSVSTLGTPPAHAGPAKQEAIAKVVGNATNCYGSTVEV